MDERTRQGLVMLSAPVILAPGPFASLELGPSVLAGVLYGLLFAWALAPGSRITYWLLWLVNGVCRRWVLLWAGRASVPVVVPEQRGPRAQAKRHAVPADRSSGGA